VGSRSRSHKGLTCLQPAIGAGWPHSDNSVSQALSCPGGGITCGLPVICPELARYHSCNCKRLFSTIDILERIVAKFNPLK
jgi:hypothetical protein